MSLTFVFMILEFNDEIKIRNMAKKIMVFCHKFVNFFFNDCNLVHLTNQFVSILLYINIVSLLFSLEGLILRHVMYVKF